MRDKMSHKYDEMSYHIIPDDDPGRQNTVEQWRQAIRDGDMDRVEALTHQMVKEVLDHLRGECN